MIRTIWAVGRNYLEHIKELGNTAPVSTTGEERGEPLIFAKAGGCVVANGRMLRYPSFSKDVHHETELAVRLKIEGDGRASFDAFTVALDLTCRDLQNTLKTKGQPWELAKSFVDACPLGDWVPVSRLGRSSSDENFEALQNLQLCLRVNGEERQRGTTADMIFKVRELCDYLVSRFPVQDGDVLLTGTPAGVGPIAPGDVLEAEIVGFTRANWGVRTP